MFNSDKKWPANPFFLLFLFKGEEGERKVIGGGKFTEGQVVSMHRPIPKNREHWSSVVVSGRRDCFSESCIFLSTRDVVSRCLFLELSS